MSALIYLDFNASTPIAPEAVEAMRPFLTDHYGNPSSLHWAGMPAKDALEKARTQVAGLLGCDPTEVVFTSGGSEANNHAIQGIFFGKRNRGALRPGRDEDRTVRPRRRARGRPAGRDRDRFVCRGAGGCLRCCPSMGGDAAGTYLTRPVLGWTEGDLRGKRHAERSSGRSASQHAQRQSRRPRGSRDPCEDAGSSRLHGVGLPRGLGHPVAGSRRDEGSPGGRDGRGTVQPGSNHDVGGVGGSPPHDEKNHDCLTRESETGNHSKFPGGGPMKSNYDLSTRCVHAGEVKDAEGSPHTPIYNTTTFEFRSTADLLDVVEGDRKSV